ncbi:uncharacterized protein K489DRAFT_374940 [Dissoconium aciculare CBS 342.82]|uniref:Zn(2)-C6 fungal-type domain-containing protein n=1 Tax=Dissoconium aciculare CBS 342.82 TaxID=1314786 RepID=A0A6J3MFW7_9PEZI|nr:uncharacterized protein K489DRAFT_374940 [Dissoconium aciculare CBS 342.82]KAF1826860.1 hypothetical protein K489DRAFT_374940 [Dissoconium aciculare CBS 342.82]
MQSSTSFYAQFSEQFQIQAQMQEYHSYAPGLQGHLLHADWKATASIQYLPRTAQPSQSSSSSTLNMNLAPQSNTQDADAVMMAYSAPQEPRTTPEKARKSFVRARLACLSCRQSKRKCDQQRPCEGCRQRGQEEDCLYDEVVKTQQLEKVVESIEELSQTIRQMTKEMTLLSQRLSAILDRDALRPWNQDQEST